MGIIDSFPFSLGSFTILDDLTDYSSDTATYVDRRRSSISQDKSKSKSKHSTTAATRAPDRSREHVTSKQTAAGAISVRGPKTARSTTVANLNVREEDTKLQATATNMSTKRPAANESVTKWSIVTAPPILDRKSSRRSKREETEEERSKRDQSSQKEVIKEEIKKEDVDVEVITNSKVTTRSTPRSQAKSREPSRAPVPSEAETKPYASSEELWKENKSLRRRTERLEKDLAAYRRHAENYRDKRRDADRERHKAEERARELETVVANMRDSYESELENLRGQITEYAAKAAAVASATQLYAKDITGGTSMREPTPPSVRDAPTKSPNVEKAPSVREISVQTEAWLMPVPSPWPANPIFDTSSPKASYNHETSILLAKLEQQEAELAALKLYYEEASQISLDDLADSVKTLNTELRNLASAMVNNVPLGRTWELAQAWALEAADSSLARCLHLLSGVKGADFSQDVILVRLALQASIVSCLQRVFEKFLFGLESTDDDTLKRVFKRVQACETPAVAARWRALTRRHARTLASPPTISPSSSRGGFGSARDYAVSLLEMDVLVGAEAILRFAGAHSPPGVLLSELSGLHGRRISLLVKHAARLASDLAERAPVGCEVFTVHLGDGAESEHALEGDGVTLCGCMEIVDQECRQWVGQSARTERGGGRSTRTRTRTNTRAGTARTKSKTRSHRSHRSRARTATTRTYADTHIRQWDRDSSEELEEEESEEDDDEVAEGEGESDHDDEDQFVESVDVKVKVGTGRGGSSAEGDEDRPSVLCSLGFGLRRVFRRTRRNDSGSQTGGTAEGHQQGPRAQASQETLQRERRRGPRQPEVETLRGSTSDAKSTYTLSSLATTTRTGRRDRDQRQHQHQHRTTSQNDETGRGQAQERVAEETSAATDREGGPGREVEVLVKTDVLLSSTVDSLRKRVVQ